MGMSLRATKHTQKDPITVRRSSEFHSRVKKSLEQTITVIRRRNYTRIFKRDSILMRISAI